MSYYCLFLIHFQIKFTFNEWNNVVKGSLGCTFTFCIESYNHPHIAQICVHVVLILCPVHWAWYCSIVDLDYRPVERLSWFLQTSHSLLHLHSYIYESRRLHDHPWLSLIILLLVCCGLLCQSISLNPYQRYICNLLLCNSDIASMHREHSVVDEIHNCCLRKVVHKWEIVFA